MSPELYGPPHKALRRALCDTLVAMSRASFEDDASSVADDLERALAAAERHLAIEERFVRPAIDARCSGGIKIVDAVHEHHGRVIEDLRAQARELAAAPPRERSEAGRALYLAYSVFVAENLAHMAEEEQLVEPLLKSLYTDDELRALHGRIGASMSPEEQLASMRFMLPALSRVERAAMLEGGRASMPHAAFARMVAAARESLGADDFADLVTRLGVT